VKVILVLNNRKWVNLRKNLKVKIKSKKQAKSFFDVPEGKDNLRLTIVDLRLHLRFMILDVRLLASQKSWQGDRKGHPYIVCS
jgi:hypothetical protein